VNGFNPWPVAETQLLGEQLRIFTATELPGAASRGASPGTVIAAEETLVVQCGPDAHPGAVALLTVQRPGRKIITGAELARSRPLAGERLG
jgi:methionyl-tRNA formyltransferase